VRSIGSVAGQRSLLVGSRSPVAAPRTLVHPWFARYPEVAHHLKPVTLLRYERMCKQLLGIGAKQKVKDAMRDVKEEVRQTRTRWCLPGRVLASLRLCRVWSSNAGPLLTGRAPTSAPPPPTR
jgi:hypothetical protein